MTTLRLFNELLRDCHVQPSYLDVTKRRRRAPIEAQLALLRSLGVEIQDPSQAGERLQARRHERLARGIEPVQVAWNGSARPATITLPASLAGSSLEYELRMDNHRVDARYRIDELPVANDPYAEANGFISRQLPLPKKLPPGYYDLHVNASGLTFTSFVISSPRKAYRRNRDEDLAHPECGIFLPLYALRNDHDWGAGDMTSLREMMHWAGRCGSSDVGTLPLLAAFLDEPFEISPYRPVSRLFWNELYIDVEAIPDVRNSAESQQWIRTDAFQRDIQAQRDADLVDYREVMQLKRGILQPLSEKFFANRSALSSEFDAFRAENPLVEDYARFRAACERRRTPWTDWPERMREGQLHETDYDPAAANYHQYVQWTAALQLNQLQRESAAAGSGLYLDLPVGVDPSGYDAWRFAEHYARGASVGSPPDIVFPKGQDWGLPPMHPDRMRKNRYDLVRGVMQNNCRFADRLRIDHVLGFHRLYCIPPGFSAAEGTYVNYPANELYAVAILESHRHRCELVGENLGTVPASVSRQIEAHGIAGMWVAPYELEPGRRTVLAPPTSNDVAMLNTHDMPLFQAWWTAADIDDRLELGLIDAAAAARERQERFSAIRQLKDWLRSPGALSMEEDAGDEQAPLNALLRTIADSEARLLLVNLEDLWRETHPQNIPGTSDERPNWRRKAHYRFEEFRDMPEVLHAISELTSLRTPKEQPA